MQKPSYDHRRAAIQVLAQLPEDQADALMVLEAAREFIQKFLVPDHLVDEGRLAGPREGVVLAFASAVTSASAE
jgi:hypothetical protein